MRPVSKGAGFGYTNGDPYERARNGLEAKLGMYCSYCERPLLTGLEVEHIQPKSVPANLHLENRWENFLLACRNCNGCKGKQNPTLDSWLIPDRDNTFLAFEYQLDGRMLPRPGPHLRLAAETLRLLNLNKRVQAFYDEQGELVAIDKRAQRMSCWTLAIRYRDKWNANQTQDNEDAIIDLAIASGFFSIWMAAFDGIPQIRKRLLSGFSGTESACFHPETTQGISPHPNSDSLQDGGKL